MPERARDLPRASGSRAIARIAAHLTVVSLLTFTAVVGVAGIRRDETARHGLPFDVVSTARGADGPALQMRSASFLLQPDPANADPLLTRRIFPTPKPGPTARPAPSTKPKPAPRQLPRVAAVAPAPVAAVVGSGKLLWPVPGATITQYFWAGHLAIDLATDYGNPVLAAATGTVLNAGWRSNGGGLVIEIDHGNGLHTLYNHLGAVLVSSGQVVGRGQRIASVGCTGLCTGPHVHFQVKVGGVFVNPLRYL